MLFKFYTVYKALSAIIFHKPKQAYPTLIFMAVNINIA